MITFHPTVSLRYFLKALLTPAKEVNECVQRLFPEHSIILTDSGRSALSVIIERLELSGKRLALPAYLCDSLLPVLRKHNITPIYLDIEEDFQPGIISYQKQFDAALLVSTYGRDLDPAIANSLTERGIIVIEDYAHTPLPISPEQKIQATARYYSINKTMPTPAGGIAIVPPSHDIGLTLPKARTTASFIKDVKKLIPIVATILVVIRFLMPQSKKRHVPSWNTARKMHTVSERFLECALRNNNNRHSVGGFKYCYPIKTSHPHTTQRKLLKHGIIAERIWDTTITDADDLNQQHFPNSKHASNTCVCVPLWHIIDDTTERTYEELLKHVLPSEFSGFRKD